VSRALVAKLEKDKEKKKKNAPRAQTTKQGFVVWPCDLIPGVFETCLDTSWTSSWPVSSSRRVLTRLVLVVAVSSSSRVITRLGGSRGQGKGENTLRLAFGAREGVVWGCVVVETCRNTSRGSRRQGKGENTLRLAFGAREGVVLGRIPAVSLRSGLPTC
jgi:hypothetical protein